MAVAKFKFARWSSAAPQRPGAPQSSWTWTEVREMAPLALVRALIAVLPGASFPLPVPLQRAEPRPVMQGVCVSAGALPLAFSRSVSLTVWSHPLRARG